MIKSLASFLFKDLRWKLLAVVLGFILWLIAMNISNPTSVAPFTRFLVVSNGDALARDGLVLLNESDLRAEQITVNVRAPQSELDVLSRRADNLEASIDLRHINPEAVMEMIETSGRPVRLPMDVFVDMLEGYERVSTRPRTVDVALDRFVRQTYDVQVLTSGEVADGYELVSVECVNKIVIVSGAKSIVDAVDAVYCQVDVADARQSADYPVGLTAVDRDGNDITHRPGLELSVRETQAQAHILPYKAVKLAIGWNGTLAYNHIVTGISLLPEEVDLVGPADALDAVETLNLETLDLTGANTSQTFSADIAKALPDTRLALRGGPAEAAVIVMIEPMQSREYRFPVGEVPILGFPAGAVRLLNNEYVTFSVLGSETDMAGLTRGHIRVSLNLTGLEVGERSVPLTINLPPGISLMGQPPRLEVVLSTPDPDDLASWTEDPAAPSTDETSDPAPIADEAADPGEETPIDETE